MCESAREHCLCDRELRKRERERVCVCVCARARARVCVADTSVDFRGCTIEASKFEDTDERNGGRIVGFVAAD